MHPYPGPIAEHSVAVPVVVIEVAASFNKTPMVTAVVISKVTVAALELSYVTLGKISMAAPPSAIFGKITAAHMWSVPTHCVGSTTAHAMRSTPSSDVGSASATTASHVATASATKACTAATSASAPSTAATPTTVAY